MGNVTPARPECRGSGRKKRLPPDFSILVSRSLKVNENVPLRSRPRDRERHKGSPSIRYAHGRVRLSDARRAGLFRALLVK